MKKSIYLTLIILIGLFTACQQSSQKKEKKQNAETIKDSPDNNLSFSDTVKYLVKLSNNGEDVPPFYTNSQSKVFLETLIDSVKNGSLKAFDSFDNHQLSFDEIETSLGEGNDTISMEDPETGELIQKITNDTFDINDIQEVYFYEHWTYNPKTLQIDKTVFGIAPVIYTAVDDTTDHRIRRRLPFVVYF